MSDALIDEDAETKLHAYGDKDSPTIALIIFIYKAD